MPRSLFTPAYHGLIQALVGARREAGLRQVDLADRLGKPQSFVSKMETGERRLDVIEFLVVARAIGVNPTNLFEGIASAVAADTRI
jgi:transcriptional regulator with XRE-family HTH domain